MSDDDVPIISRVTAAASAGPSKAQAVIDELEDDDDLPDWAKAFNSPYKGGYKPPPLPSSSDDDIMDLTKDSQPTPGVGPPSQQPPSQAAASQPAAHSQPEPSGIKAQPAGKGRDKAAGRQQPSTTSKGRGKNSATAVQGSAAGLDDAQDTQPQVTQEAMDMDDADDTLPATQHAPASQRPGAAEKATPARGRAPPLPLGAQLPIMLPERLPRNKMLVELSAVGSTEEVLDLAGDAGAVGRLIVAGKAGHPDVSVDLKGVVFQATVLPLQGTALVINVQPNEARVEAIMNDFVRLTSQGTGSWGLDDDEGGGGGLAALLGDDDEDHYTLATQGDGEGGATHKAAGKGGKGAKAKAKAGQSTPKKSAGGKTKPGKKALGTQGGAVRKRKTVHKKPAGTGKAVGKGKN